MKVFTCNLQFYKFYKLTNHNQIIRSCNSDCTDMSAGMSEKSVKPSLAAPDLWIIMDVELPGTEALSMLDEW